jgi:type IV secretory pathway ATPase VirB11/archaellum biosynthesis ATPase
MHEYGMTDLTLFDLVRNGTISAEMAAALACAAEERRSLLFVAIPRMAGKSTVMRAALQHIPEGTAIHHLARSKGPQLGIPDEADGGYLIMSEIAPTGFDDYLWDEEVRTVFAALPRGFSLATALHAPGIDEAFEVITRINGVPDAQAGHIGLVTYIRSLGQWRTPDRRIVERIYEVDGVSNGRPEARLLHRWSEQDDRFEVVEDAQRIGANSERYAHWLREFRAA